jgi:hypothetical protein
MKSLRHIARICTPTWMASRIAARERTCRQKNRK